MTRSAFVIILDWFSRMLFLVIVFCITGCTGLKNASEDNPLFTGYKLKLDTTVHEQKNMLNEFDGVVQPQPNKKFLWMRPTVALHNMIKEPEKEKGLKYFLKYKIGNKGVYMSDVPWNDVVAAMENRMVNRGYFNGEATYEEIPKGKTSTVDFIISPRAPYYYYNIEYPEGNSEILRLLKSEQKNSLLKTGEIYNLEVIKQERERLTHALRDTGYYYLNTNHLVFIADTAAEDFRSINMFLRLKTDIPPLARLPYTVEDIYLHSDFQNDSTIADTLRVDELYYLDYLGTYRPHTITNGVFMREGERYSRKFHDNTINYLMGYGVFRYSNVLFELRDTMSQALAADITLSPQKERSFFYEVNAISKSNNFAGPGLKIGYKDRNFFRGAETFTINIDPRFETQLSGPGRGSTSYEISIKGSLAIPRVVPIKIRSRESKYVPTTNIVAGYGIFRRVNLYLLQSANAGLSYRWRSDRGKFHQFTPFEVSLTRLANTTDVFEEFLDDNAFIRRSFEEQFILSTGYTYTYLSSPPSERKFRYVAILGGEIAGNVPYLGGRISGPMPEEGYRLLGLRFSQYVRLIPELRSYLPVGRKDAQIASRLMINAAIPYGNSDVIPYVKQFFVGGPNSIRAFRARSIGPGTHVTESMDNRLQIDQSGDVKIEGNVEYRFTIRSFLKGALFLDAGNVWLVNEDPDRPGGNFVPSRIWQELAVGTGFGIRGDLDFIVIRLDLAFPLRAPFLPENERWLFDKISPMNSSWRSENLILNIAIGYPF